MIAARKLAESFRTPVIVLSDANLATGQCPFPMPEVSEDWLSPPVDQSPWPGSVPPYAWDKRTGLSMRPIPGQLGGQYVLTGLANNECTKINGQLFQYNAEKQAYIADASAGSFKQLVKAAELCPARCIHPGQPRAGDATATPQMIERAARFN